MTRVYTPSPYRFPPGSTRRYWAEKAANRVRLRVTPDQVEAAAVTYCATQDPADSAVTQVVRAIAEGRLDIAGTAGGGITVVPA